MEHSTTPSGWLAFELSILHRLKFDSVAIPLTGDPAIGAYLKRRDIRVSTNDLLQVDRQRAMATVQNSNEKLTDNDVNLLLEDVYVPGYKLSNPALRNWFSEVDAWWFDNVHRNIERLDTPVKCSLAASLVIATGDYVLSFTDETRDLRQPLSTTFRRLWTLLPEPVDGGTGHSCHNQTPDTYVAESTAELMFLRLPKAEIRSGDTISRPWREEWFRGASDFWTDFENSMAGKLGRPVETKSQYVRILDDLLGRASHLKHWAVSHIESGFISSQEVTDIIAGHRRVEAVYTKDFSELTGKKAVIITA